MMFKTHLAFGLLVGLLALIFFEISDKYIFLGFVLFASILPDIDLSKSKIGKMSKPFSSILNFLFGHRGFLHSIFPGIFVFILFVFIKKELVGFAILIGYFSHLVIDCLNKEGIGLFYPFSKIRLRSFVKTGGLVEYCLFFILLMLNFIMVLKFF